MRNYITNNKNKENVVVIFAKKPRAGEVKTRIARETSSQFAYEFYKACFIDLLNKIRNSNYYDLIIACDNSDDLSWFQNNFNLDGLVIKWHDGKNKKETQSNKFESIFSNLLCEGNYQQAVLIPMDIPFISEEDLISAFVRFEDKKFVLGPEVNGGVYLVGIKKPYKNGLFKNISWSTSSSFQNLLRNFTKEKTFCMKLKNDLNMPEDILKLRDEIRHNCPILYEFLDDNNYYFSIKNRYINYDDLSICIPVVSNVVQKKDNGKISILLQTRHKPSVDPTNSGKLEVPSGLIKKYELAQDTAVREVKEEAGINCRISKDQKVYKYITHKNGEKIGIYKPFHCQQQVKGGRSYLVISFISDYISGVLEENPEENKKPEWIELKEIKKIIKNKPDKLVATTLATLNEYLKLHK